jgi:hypothetical protein
MKPRFPALFATALLLCHPATAFAGMPSPHLTDIGRLRLEGISFFLFGFLLSALFIKLLWNYLRKDFTRLPRLSYPKALGVVALWGLLFVLVLTMISGARELMTPGAWQKSGLTYRLKQGETIPTQPSDEERRQGLDKLRLALWVSAKTRDGRFPESPTSTDFPADLWLLPGSSGLRYIYVAGLKVDQGRKPLAYEPEVDGPQRWVLFANGDIQRIDFEQLKPLLTGSNVP